MSSYTPWATQDTNETAAQPLATCAANCGRHPAPRAGLILQPEICKNQSSFCRPKTVCRARQGGTLWVRAAAPWPHKTQMKRLPSPWPLGQRTAAGTLLHVRASFCSQKSVKRQKQFRSTRNSLRLAGTADDNNNGLHDHADRKVVLQICENRMPNVHGADAGHGCVSWLFSAVVA